MINRILSETKATNGQDRAAVGGDGDDAQQFVVMMGEQAKQLQKHAEQLITAHPVVALSIAVVAGLAVGWLVKRK